MKNEIIKSIGILVLALSASMASAAEGGGKTGNGISAHDCGHGSLGAKGGGVGRGDAVSLNMLAGGGGTVNAISKSDLGAEGTEFGAGTGATGN